MDHIYKPFDRQASPKICLKDYFQQYGELIKSSICHEIDKQSDEEIFQLMGTNRLEARVHLKQYCSVENLTLLTEISTEAGEKQGYINRPENLDNVSLETVKILKILSKETLLKTIRNQNGIPIKYERDKKHDKNNLRVPDIKPGEEFLIYVRVYEPFKSYPRALKYKMGIPTLKLKNVISILGCQTLYELRQKIMCQSDLSITKETSKNPNEKPGPMAKDIYKSGFFYIEDTFYNDTSLPTNIDYSKIILEWASTRDIGPFKVATMGDSQINSLSTKFGFPWVYQHQGCCEHLIVFTDARLITVDDVLTPTAYPRIERIRPVSGKNCIYCGIFNVHWIVTDHDRIPHDISYFCNRCFISYNYVDGKKVGNFKAYSYPCIPELMSIIKEPKKKS